MIKQDIMGCDCCLKHGGAGRSRTPYTWHLYTCEFFLNELPNYSYEDFKLEYEYQKKHMNSLQLYNYFTSKNK
jgi:hypothetical protein